MPSQKAAVCSNSTQISLTLDCCPRNVFGFTIFLCDVPFWREGRDRTEREVAVVWVGPLCWWSVYVSVIYLLYLLQCSSCALPWQLSLCQCFFMPSCCQVYLKDCALIQCIVCYRQLITLVWTAMWCSVSSICLTMLLLGTIRWGMHSVCTVNTCYASSFIVVIQRFHLGWHGQYNDSTLEFSEVRHTLDTWDSQGIHRGHLEMTIPEMKSDNFTSNWNMYRFWQ